MAGSKRWALRTRSRVLFRGGCALLAACLLILSAGAATLQSGDVTVTLPDAYTVITADNLDAQSELLRRAGKSPEDIRPYFDQGCIFIALPPGRDFEISMTRMTDATSQGAGNLIDLTLDEQDRFRTLLLGDAIEQGKEVQTIERGGALFFRVSDPSDESSSGAASYGAVGGQEKTIYYVTILNGNYLTLSLSDPSGRLLSGVVEQFENVFQSLEFEVTGLSLDVESTKLTVVKVLLWVLCALGVAVVFWLVFSISRGYHRRKRETAWQRKRRPKPRR